LGSKSAALVAAVFVDFPKNHSNFLHKNKLDIMTSVTPVNSYSEFTVKLRKKFFTWVQFLTGRHPMRIVSPAAVATIAPRKSAPMHSGVSVSVCLSRRAIASKPHWRAAGLPIDACRLRQSSAVSGQRHML